MHPKSVFKLLSYLILLLAFIMLVPMVFAIFCNEDFAYKAFLKTFIIMIVAGVATLLISRKGNVVNLSQRDGFLFTALTWIIATGFGSLPLFLTDTLPCYSDCFFEIMSGFTTTGASRLMDVESCMKSVLLWRSMTNWLGGMGIVVLFIAILPAIGSGAGAFNLIGAETVGPVKGKLTPKTKNTALVLWLLYLALTVIQVILLLCGGLNLFDSVNIAFSTVSTAGFSVRNASIGSYNSAYVDIVVTAFMLLAAINFSLYYKALKGSWDEIITDTELKYFLGIVGLSSLSGALFLRLSKTYRTIGEALRYMAFHIASVISTTGFSNADFLAWPTFCIMLVILMMFIGGCAGSTGGGIKVIRIAVIMKSSRISLHKRIHQNGVYTLTVNNQIVKQDTVFSILSFCTTYILTWIIGALVISLTGLSILDCLSSSILTLGNIGLGFARTPFAEYPHWTNWVFSFLMLCGRLELFTVYALFSRAINR